MLVDAHSGCCTRAPAAATFSHRSPVKMSRNRWYAFFAFAIAIWPRNGEPSGSFSSAEESTRETKKDATEAGRSVWPSASRRSSPAMYARATSSYRSTLNSNVMFTFTPAAVSSSTAGTPSAVPGTLIIAFGRSMRAKSSLAFATDAFVSCAIAASSSNDTNPRAPFESSNCGRNRSAAIWMSSSARS